MSLLASFMSAITILGTPAEVYIYGTQYWIIGKNQIIKSKLKRLIHWFNIGISYIFTIYLTATLFMPMFVKLEVTSAYEVKNNINKFRDSIVFLLSSI
jgi:sodium-coupled monocarboxylate transporter 8/12